MAVSWRYLIEKKYILITSQECWRGQKLEWIQIKRQWCCTDKQDHRAIMFVFVIKCVGFWMDAEKRLEELEMETDSDRKGNAPVCKEITIGWLSLLLLFSQLLSFILSVDFSQLVRSFSISACLNIISITGHELLPVLYSGLDWPSGRPETFQAD